MMIKTVTSLFKLRTKIFILLFCLIPNLSQADDATKALNFVKELGDKAVQMLADNSLSEEKKISKFEQLLDEGFDVPLIARYALGKYWRKTSTQKRKEYIKSFHNFIVDSYAARLGQFGGENFSQKEFELTGKKGLLLIVLLKLLVVPRFKSTGGLNKKIKHSKYMMLSLKE